MNDWIYHYFAAFWGACILFGMAVGAFWLAEDHGLGAGLGAGFLLGAGTALILSASRYIGGSHEEDDAPFVPPRRED